MRKLKSFLLTILISGGFLGAMYVIPIQIEKKPKIEFPVITEEESLLGEGDEVEEKILDLPEEIDIPEIVVEAPALEEVKQEQQEEIVQVEQPKKEEIKEESKKSEEKKIAEKKEDNKKTSEKESKIGEDRKLIAGIPGTLNYKGKFPPHNVKEKGSITITYTVDESGKVISAYRSAGLRDRNTINNAITLVRKYVKAEKSKTKSTGTYTIEFK